MACSGAGDSLQYRLEKSMLPSCEWHWDVNGNQQEHATDCGHWSLSVAHSTQTVCPPPKLRHIHRMSTSSQNNSQHSKLCHLSCTPITNTPQNYPFLAVLGAWKTLCTEIGTFYTGVRMHTPIHVFYFKNGLNRCRIIGQKGGVALDTEKTHFGTLRWNP